MYIPEVLFQVSYNFIIEVSRYNYIIELIKCQVTKRRHLMFRLLKMGRNFVFEGFLFSTKNHVPQIIIGMYLKWSSY